MVTPMIRSRRGAKNANAGGATVVAGEHAADGGPFSGPELDQAPKRWPCCASVSCNRLNGCKPAFDSYSEVRPGRAR